MRPFLKSFLLIATVSFFAHAQIANHVVISEVAPMNGSSSVYNTGEFIELYNPTGTDVTFGPNVVIASGKLTSGSNAAEWQLSLSGVTVKAFGYYLIADAGLSSPTRDLTFPSSKNLSNSGVRSVVALVDGATTIDTFAWDPLTTPQIPAEGTPFTPSSTSSNKKSFERKSSSSAISDDSFGNGYDSGNNATDFFENDSLHKNPQNSSSSAEIPYTGADTIAPSVFSVKPLSNTAIEIVFNEPVDSLTSSSSAHYAMNKSISVSQALRDGANLSRVLLTVTTMVPDVYTLTISGVKDTAGNVMPTPKVIQFSYGTLTMAQARAAGAGAIVRIRGIVTVANEFASPSFLQDSTGAMGVFNTKFSSSAKVGDIWEVAGTIQNYYGLFEINPLTDSVKISSGNALPKPLVVTSTQLGESLEGQLVRINKAKFALSGNFGGASADSAYTASDASGSFSLYIDKDTNIPSSAIPGDSANVVGIVTQFVGGYQLQPRSLSDIGVIDPPPDQTWMNIITARGMPDGSSVTFRGIVTFVQPSGTAARTVYIQDATGGIAAYHPATDTLLAGDSVQVSGKLSTYSTFLEVNPVDSLTLFARGLTLPLPESITIPTASESYESELVKLDEVRFVETGTFLDGTSGANYHVTDGANQLIVRIPKNSLLTGTPIPVGAMNAVGVLAEFSGAYQLTPRSPADLVALPGPQIVGPPAITALADNSFTVSWVTLLNGNSVLAYGLSPSIPDTVTDQTLATTHSVALSGLKPGRVYYVKVLSTDGSGTSVSNLLPVVTTSPASSGEMDVYFNYSTDATLGLVPAANGGTALMNKLLERISKATKSIDLALYSFDDFGGNSAVVSGRVADSLVAAKGRGVAVRMVFDNKATTTPLAKLITAGISVIKRTLPGTDNGIMHNKFMVFDGRDTTSATDDWVITGSWNVTNDGTTDDAQNAVFIQDQSLA
ncbi:MAG TPA: DUF5689 domain-containing protein, partial [Bacteroidota bacterium]|nr:DUF5689 domain-containing protein [Bacteroidota bacterium]